MTDHRSAPGTAPHAGHDASQQGASQHDGSRSDGSHVDRPEVIDGGAPSGSHPAPAPPAEPESESVGQPGKVMRIGTMIKQLLDEVKASALDDASRARMADIYQRSVDELATALSPDLESELRSLAHPFSGGHVPSDAELRVAHAQLVGWLEGLFHGIQATLMAQQLAARQQLEQMRGGRELPPGMVAQGPDDGSGRPGTYL